MYVREHYEKKKAEIESCINENTQAISEISMGKKNLKTFTGKGTPEEIKFKLEVENETLKRQKENTAILVDIITALIAHIEIHKYKQAKNRFYKNVLLKLSGYELSQVQNYGEIWDEVGRITKKTMQSS